MRVPWFTDLSKSELLETSPVTLAFLHPYGRQFTDLSKSELLETTCKDGGWRAED